MEEKVWKVMTVSDNFRAMDEILERRCPMEGPVHDIDSMSDDSSGEASSIENDMAYWYTGLWAEFEHPELQSFRWCRYGMEFLPQTGLTYIPVSAATLLRD